MKCKNCNSEIDINDKFCSKCGAQNKQDYIYCSNCGTKVSADADTCPNCGRLIKKQSYENSYYNAQGTQSSAQSNATPPYMAVENPAYQRKSKIAAGLLGIFLGTFGVHNFYLGYTAKAVVQLLITVCTCGFGSAISSIWGFIEGIFILTGNIKVDGKGVPLGD